MTVERVAQAAEEAAALEGPPPRAPLVLIAEDERAIAALVVEIVTGLGYRAVVATHGRRALELARDEWPTLLISDLMMPHLDGAGLISALQAEAAAQGVPAPPVIMMTAASVAYAQAVAADVVVRKPFNVAEVEALVQRFVGQSAGDRDPLPAEDT